MDRDQLLRDLQTFTAASAAAATTLADLGDRSAVPAILDSIARDCGWEVIVATSGMFAKMPVGTPHSFKNESNRPAKMLISVAPAVLEQMFFEVGVPVEQGTTTAAPPTKDEIERLLATAPKYGIVIRLAPHD